MPTIHTQKSFRTMLTGLCLTLALLGSGCGGGNPTSESTPPTPATATIVVVLAAPSTPVSVSVDGQVLDENLSYMTSTNPLIVSSGQHQLLLRNSLGPVGPSQNGIEQLDLQPSSHTTFLYIFPAIFGIFLQVMTDDTTPAPNSMAKLRVASFAFNSVPGINAPIDVFVVPFGSAPSGTPFLTGVQATGSTANPVYQTLPPGNYDVYFVTEQNNSGQPPPTVVCHTGSLPLAANQNRSVYFFVTCQDPTGGGCAPNGYTTVTVADLN